VNSAHAVRRQSPPGFLASPTTHTAIPPRPYIQKGLIDSPSNTHGKLARQWPEERHSFGIRFALAMKSLPDWNDIPAVEGMPHGCAWGLWDKPGEGKDQLGSLNLLTPEVVREAIKEVQTGERCALKYAIL
jgi:hypothetical protein